MKRSKALYLRSVVEKASISLDDKVASTAVTLFPKLKGNGELINVGARINHNGKLLRASVDLWDTEENNPDNAPTLWEEIQYKDGIRIIPETITVGTAFAKSEKGWWEGVLHESLLDNNVWTPAQNPSGWVICQIN